MKDGAPLDVSAYRASRLIFFFPFLSSLGSELAKQLGVTQELEMQKPLVIAVIAGGWCVHVTLGK